jgi:vitamin B12 transporter
MGIIVNSFKLVSLVCCVPVFFTALSAVADDESREPEVMVVSAARTAMDLRKVASSVTVIDREFLAQRQSVYIVDVLRDVPGLSVNRSGSAGGLTEVRSRGGEANQLLVLIDGIRANDPAAGDRFSWESLTTYDVERIEVVRGPQSAVWGSDANTGVINIITRKGESGLAGSGFIEAGSYDSVNGGLRIGGGNELLSWGVNGSYLEQDGFNNAQQGSEDDPLENKTVGGNIGIRPSENSRIDLVARYTDADAKADWQDCVPSPGNDPCPTVVSDSVPDSISTTQFFGGLTGEIGFIDNRWTHQLMLGLTDSENDSVYQFRIDPTTVAEGQFASEGSLLEVRYQTNWDFARGGAVAGTDLITFAVDRQEREYKNSFGIDAETEQTGLVLEGRTLLLEALTLTGSIRYDDNSDYDDVTTWRVTSGYSFATGTRLRGAVGTGQKAPTMTELYGFFPGFTGNPDLKPESSKGWEVGADQGFFDDAYSVSLTYFDERLEDQIVTAYPPPSFSATVVNAPDKTVRNGVELAMSGRFTEQFTGKLAYTYLDSDAVVLAGDTVIGRSREIRRPRNSLSLNLNYAFLQQRANVNLNASYTDSQEDNVFYSDFSSARTELDSYTLVDLTGEYDVTQSFAVYGRIANLFDEKYEEVFSYNTPGRAAFVGARVSLGR